MMVKGRASSLFVFLLFIFDTSTMAQDSTVHVVLDAYSNSPNVTSPVKLGTSLHLNCHIAGIRSSIQVRYEWSCSGNRGCNVGSGRYPNRQATNAELVVNVLSQEDAGVYTCTVIDEDTDMILGQGTYSLAILGGTVMSSGDNLLPSRGVVRHQSEFTSLDAQQLDLRCRSNGDTLWINTKAIRNTDITVNGSLSNLRISPTSLFLGGQFDCYVNLSFSSNVYLFANRSGSLNKPLFSSAAYFDNRIAVSWQSVVAVDRYILSYKRTGAPATLPAIFLDRYPDILTAGTIDGDLLVPGATYEIGLWAVRTQTDVSFVSAPATILVMVPEIAPSPPRLLQIVSTLNSTGVELNWLPSVNPNGNTRSYIQYSTDGSFQAGFTEMAVLTDSVHFSVTGLESGTMYHFRIKTENSNGFSFSGSVTVMFELPTIEPSSASTVNPHQPASLPSGQFPSQSVFSSMTSSSSSPPLVTQQPINVQEPDTGPNSSQIVLYVVVPLCLVLVVAVVIGVTIVIVLICRSRRASHDKGVTTDLHYTSASVAIGHGRSHSFVANPGARRSHYDSLNAMEGSRKQTPSPNDQNFSERAIDIDFSNYSTADLVGNGGGLNSTHGSTDSVDVNEHLYETAEPHPKTSNFPYTWKDSSEDVSKLGTGSSADTHKESSETNPEDVYSKPDMSKKKSRRDKDILPHQIRMSADADEEVEDQANESEASTSIASQQKPTTVAELQLGMWNTESERPWSIS